MPKNAQKTQPECLKIGEFSSEGGRRLLDDEKPGIYWEKDLKYQMEWCKISLNILTKSFHSVR
jgi:hypothetical protein